MHAACADEIALWASMTDEERGAALDKKNPAPTPYTYETTIAYLQKQEWPSWVMNDVLTPQAVAA